MKGAGILVFAFLLPLSLMYVPSADPAYGLLRTYGSESTDAALDIEVDEDGIYVVGYTYSARWRKPQPSLTVLNSDHTHRCSTFLEFESEAVYGMSTSVEVNSTHVFVAGFYWTSRLGAIAVFVAVFSKTDCKMTGLYTLYVTDYEEISIHTLAFGEGIDLAVDETGVYLLVGYFIFQSPYNGFHVLKLDQYLNSVAEDFYRVRGDRAFGLSIALGAENVYVAGLTNYLLNKRFDGDRVFLLVLDKTDLSVQNVTLIQPIDEYFGGLEVVVDENEDIYVVQTEQKWGALNTIAVTKFDKNINLTWRQAYLLMYPYVDSSQPTPEHIPAQFAHGVSAAVSSAYLFVGGFTTTNYVSAGDEISSGLLLAINRMDGEGLFAFRIQPQGGPTQNVQVLGVDSLGDCAYVAGRSENYRLEYIFLNNFNFTFPPLFERDRATPLGLKHERRNDRPDINNWTPVFDKDTGASSYSVYGVFCAGSMIARTTTTSTATETSTTTVTRTERTTAVDIITRSRTITRTTTSTSLVKTTTSYFQTVLIHSTYYTTQERIIQSTIFDTVYQTLRTTLTDSTTVTKTALTTPPPTTRLQNTTTTVYVNTTRYVTTTTAKEVDWLSLPPWFYTPFFLLPIPLLAMLLGRHRYSVMINKAVPPYGWKPGDHPIIDDVYMTPSVLNIPKNSTVTFINKDDDPHIITSYDGPVEYLFKSDTIMPGKKWKRKFTEPGIYYVKSLTKQYVGGIIRVGR